MGYPVRYRNAVAKQVRASSQTSAPKKSGTVIRFPERRMQGFTNTSTRNPDAPRGAPRGAYKPRPNYNPYRTKFGAKPRVFNPFGLATRQSNQRALIGALKGGLNFRRKLLYSVSRYVLRNLMTYALQRVFWHQRPIQTGWTVTGLWGLSGNHGGTAAHTTGSVVSHNPGPITFGHPWTGPPYDWAEYDTVTRVVNPITMAISHSFLQVGRGDMGTGPDPRFMNDNKDLFPGLQAPSINPWASPYNPSWNRFPGRWPNNFPVPERMPNFEPGDMPINGPEPMPMPMPWAAIPQQRPNPYRSPSEQTQRGPFRVRLRPNPEPEPITWPDLIREPTVEPEVGPNQPPTRQPQNRDRFEPGKRPRRGPNRQRDAKPGRKVKEKKSKVSQRFARIMLAAINGVTEFNDLVNALYKALPRNVAPRGTLLKDRWGIVYRNLDKLDLNAAVRAIIRNQIEDALYGRLGSLGGKGAHNRGDVIDKISRNLRKLQDSDNQSGSISWTNDPVGVILDAIFGENS